MRIAIPFLFLLFTGCTTSSSQPPADTAKPEPPKKAQPPAPQPVPPKPKPKINGSREKPVTVSAKDFLLFPDTHGLGYFRIENVWIGWYKRWEQKRDISVAISTEDEHIAQIQPVESKERIRVMAFILPEILAKPYIEEFPTDSRYNCNLNFEY
jgi:hypothetical protein